MKLYKYIAVLSLLIVYSCGSSSNALKQQKLKNAYTKTKELVNSKQFQFEAQWANPLDNQAVSIASRLPGAQGVFQGNRVNLSGNSNYIKLDDLFWSCICIVTTTKFK